MNIVETLTPTVDADSLVPLIQSVGEIGLIASWSAGMAQGFYQGYKNNIQNGIPLMGGFFSGVGRAARNMFASSLIDVELPHELIQNIFYGGISVTGAIINYVANANPRPSKDENIDAYLSERRTFVEPVDKYDQ